MLHAAICIRNGLLERTQRDNQSIPGSHGDTEYHIQTLKPVGNDCYLVLNKPRGIMLHIYYRMLYLDFKAVGGMVSDKNDR